LLADCASLSRSKACTTSRYAAARLPWRCGSMVCTGTCACAQATVTATPAAANRDHRGLLFKFELLG
jgi:hypothetical protein